MLMLTCKRNLITLTNLAFLIVILVELCSFIACIFA